MEFFPTSNQTKILCEPLDFAAFQRKAITYNHDDSYSRTWSPISYETRFHSASY